MGNVLFIGNKKIESVGFFGYGSSTRSLAGYLMKSCEGLSFTLRSDKRVDTDIPFDKVFFERAARENISEDLLFLSPSVRRDAEEFLLAQRRGTILSSDAEFFFERKNIPILSVTGSDGKSTTAALVSRFLSEGGKNYPAAGNFGLPLTELLDREDISGAVAELSSFQLMNFLPRSERALITNLSPNHLDWHRSIDEYFGAKENILRLAKKRIFNLDSPECAHLLDKYPAFALYSRTLSYREMAKRYAANHYFYIENGWLSDSGEPLFDTRPLPLKGEHNISNLLAAASLTCELISPSDMARGAAGFSGLSHRAELVGIFDGIKYYDSSIDSTPTRTATTLRSMHEPTVLILGGRGKNLSYDPLFPLPDSLSAIVACGESRDEIREALIAHKNISKGDIAVYFESVLGSAVMLAIRCAAPGYAVLLSPAATSFDSFSDYKERGKTFSDIIKKYYAEK